MNIINSLTCFQVAKDDSNAIFDSLVESSEKKTKPRPQKKVSNITDMDELLPSFYSICKCCMSVESA